MSAVANAEHRLLVDWCTFPPVGHAVEGLRMAGSYKAANPRFDVSLVLNARTAVDLAGCCPWLTSVHTIDFDVFADRLPDDAFADVPRDWDWVHLGGYRGPGFFAAYPQIERLTIAATTHYRAAHDGMPPRVREWPLRLELPAAAHDRAEHILGAEQIISVLPSGGGERWLYPSAGSWILLLDELRRGFPDATIVLLGKSTGHRPSGLLGGERLPLLRAVDGIDGYDLPLLVQLAIVQRSGLLFSPHSGFGFTASALGTPWLTLSGGPYPEYFLNGTPFHSLLPDTTRFPAFDDQAHPATDDDGSGKREASMTRARIVETLPELLLAAQKLLAGASYDECLAEYFPALLDAFHGDRSKIGSWDEVHLRYL